MNYHEVEKSENEYIPPVPVLFFIKIDGARFFGNIHSDKKENTSDYVKVDVR